MAEVKEAAIDYPGRLRRSVEGVGVLYKTCSPATRLEDCPSENRDGPGKNYVSELRRNLAHSPPSHISKMVLSTVHVGGAYTYRIELVSEVSAPLSAAKLCDDRRNNTWK